MTRKETCSLGEGGGGTYRFPYPLLPVLTDLPTPPLCAFLLQNITRCCQFFPYFSRFPPPRESLFPPPLFPPPVDFRALFLTGSRPPALSHTCFTCNLSAENARAWFRFNSFGPPVFFNAVD